MRDVWPELRAALLLAVIAVHGLAAAPLPHPVSRDELRSPVAREEVARWAERLTALGYTIGPDRLGERVIAVSGAIGGAHREALAPFAPLFAFTGTGQGWALFANPDIYPTRLQIRVARAPKSADPDWELLYQRNDPAHAWQDTVLRYRRVRGVYDAGGPRSTPRSPYKRFAAWVAARVFADDRGVRGVEVRMVRSHTTIPGAPRDPRLEVVHPVVTWAPEAGR